MALEVYRLISRSPFFAAKKNGAQPVVCSYVSWAMGRKGENQARNPRFIWANYNDQTAEVTPNGGLLRESPQNALNSGLGIIVICPDLYILLSCNLRHFILKSTSMIGST